jgi:hypothetical protein
MTKNIENHIAVIICPPLSKFPEAPKDQSTCEAVDCPDCENKMWLSEKKKGVIAAYDALGKEIITLCYNCMTKHILDDPSIMINHTTADL